MTPSDSGSAIAMIPTTPATSLHRCPGCGALNTGDVYRCRFCSAPLFERGRCTVCGDTVDPSMELCSSCGSSLAVFPPEPLLPAPLPPPRWQRQALPAALVFTALSLAVAIVIMLTSHARLLGLVAVLSVIVAVLLVARLSQSAAEGAQEGGPTMNLPPG